MWRRQAPWARAASAPPQRSATVLTRGLLSGADALRAAWGGAPCGCCNGADYTQDSTVQCIRSLIHDTTADARACTAYRGVGTTWQRSGGHVTERHAEPSYLERAAVMR